jgi:hypothetical protein
LNADVLRRLAALQLPSEAMREVLNIIADIQSVDDARREKERNRKREWRDKDVTKTGQSQDIGRDGDGVSPPKKVSPITPSKNTPPSSLSVREEFRELVAAYPKRKGRNPLKPALKSYERALAAGTTHAEILAGAKREHARCSEEKIIGTPYVPQLVTWINQEGWRDNQSAEPTGPVNPGEREMDFFRSVGRWNAVYGPEPGQLGCRVAPEILEKYGYKSAA